MGKMPTFLLEFIYDIVKVLKRAVLWVDVDKVRDVIAEVNVRRWVRWREPDRVDPQASEVIDLLQNTCTP